MPTLDPNKPSYPSEAARVLRELAEQYWRLAGNSPDPDPYRMQAIKFHSKAIKLEHGIMECEW
jgi:hypothetical protein